MVSKDRKKELIYENDVIKMVALAIQTEGQSEVEQVQWKRLCDMGL